MKLSQARRTPGYGFTLIELLVVISIIGVLMALLSAAVFRVLGKGPEVMTRQDISQLSQALESFKVKYGFYPPSRLKLCEKYTDYADTLFDKDSQFYLTKLAPRMVDTWVSRGIDWNQNGTYEVGTPVILEGDQCLVFFLGGP